MTDLEIFLREIKLFAVSASELHFYIGNLRQPRSSMVIIRGQRITSPIRIPPLSVDSLVERYHNAVELEDKILHPRIKMILSILSVRNFLDITITKQILETCSWDEYNEASEEISLLLPVTETIKTLIANPTNKPKLLEYFITLLAHPNRSERQQALTKLLQFGSDGYCLINYVFWTRSEITISVIREAGRQGISLPFILDHCLNLIRTGDKSYIIFAKAYLLQFKPEAYNSSLNHNDDLREKKYYLQKKRKSRIYSILSDLKETTDRTPEALSIFTILHDTKYFTFEIINFIMVINRDKLKSHSLRVALMKLLQFGETRGSPRIIAAVVAIASIFDKIRMEEELVVDSYLNDRFRHVKLRVLSILNLWQDLDKNEKLDEIFSYLLQIHPTTEVDSSINDISSISNKWIIKHPIFQFFQTKVLSILENSAFILEIAYYQAMMGNVIIRDLVSSNLEYKPNEISNLSRKILLSQTYTESNELASTIEAGTNANEDIFLEIYPSLDMVQKFAAVKVIIPLDQFKQLVGEILVVGGKERDYFNTYLKMIATVAKESLEEHFIIIEELVLDKFEYEAENPMLKEFILSIIIKWSEVTGTFLTERVQRTVDTFKIIYQEDVDNFDLESSKPLAIETIAQCYSLTNGTIPRFVESNIQFSFTKPVWDQLAKHYLALGISRPKREAIAKSKLKEIPNYLLRDVLGQIALVNQTMAYCERNGFRKPLENLIISNMYRRGWNVERGSERTIPSYLGAVSPRLRSYFAAYLVIEHGEISTDILLWARDVEDYLIRDRIVRELERYGTSDMWIVLANSYHKDMQTRAIEQIKDSRMSSSERSKVIIDLLSSTSSIVFDLGLNWLQKHGIQQDDLYALLSINNDEIMPEILEYLKSDKQHFTETHAKLLFHRMKEFIWKPGISSDVIISLGKLSTIIKDDELVDILKLELRSKLSNVSASNIDDTISLLSYLEDKHAK